MGSKENINTADERIQGLLESYLLIRSSNRPSQSDDAHLDEDTLAALSEGNLSFREAKPIVSHLGDCSFCRHRTAELVKLELALGDDVTATASEAAETEKASGFLSGVLSKLFGGGDAAVFAHEEKDAEDEAGTENEKKTK